MTYDILIDRCTNPLDTFSVTMVRRNDMYIVLKQPLIWLLVVLVSLPWPVRLAAQGTDVVFKPEEIEQLVAPIALYPDSLVSQILMASTYPLEVVEAARWAKANKTLKGDALTAALEKQTWDPSVKSLVNFPQVLDMMNEKLDLTQRLGDACLAQQKDVLDAIQRLRAKAQAQGNLKTTKEQTVIVEQPPAQTTIVEQPAAQTTIVEQPPAQTTVIKIEPANPQVVYVPTYNPTVVYGAWPYPTYPPYTYYPPGYAAATAAFSFTAGVALGAAWGYAWGGCNWHGGDVDINVNRNTNFNTNINRQRYQANFQARGLNAQGAWQHDATHRRGVAYRDQGTAQRFNRGTNAPAAQSREAFRGRAESGRQELARGGADRIGQAGERERSGSREGHAGDRGGRSSREGRQGDTRERSGAGSREGHAGDRGGRSSREGRQGDTRERASAGSRESHVADRGGLSGREGGLGDRSAQRSGFGDHAGGGGSAGRGRQADAFQDLGRGSDVRNASARGASSWGGGSQSAGGGGFQRAGGGSHGGGGGGGRRR
jgi:hypothetical protein